MSSSWSSCLTEDKDVLSLEDEAFKEVMEQLTDYKKPERDKCPLVRKLNVDVTKDESSVESRFDVLDGITSPSPSVSLNGPNSGRRKNKGGNKQQNNSVNSNNSRRSSYKQERGSSQSLQDLTEGERSNNNDNHKRGKGMKGNRANSFCRESSLDKQELETSSSTSKTREGFNKNEHNNWSSKNLTASYSSSSSSSHNNNHASSLHQSSSQSSSQSPNQQPVKATLNLGNNNNRDCDACDSSTFLSSSFSSHQQREQQNKPCQHLHHQSEQLDSKSQALFGEEETSSSIELLDLSKRAQIVNYSSQVDSFVNFSNLVTGRRPNTSEPSTQRQLDVSGVDHKDRSNSTNDHTGSSLVNNSSRALTSSLKSNVVKKKKKEEPKLLAQDIEGYVGDRDVDYLTQYIIGMDSKAAALKRDRKSKTENGKKTRPQRSSSAENSKGRSPSPLPSPGHTASMSSYDADELTLRDEFSDGEGEKGYHTDQDSGFQVIRQKKRYNRHNRRPQTQSVSASASESTAMTSRGYESEKEFYPEEDFRMSQVMKRKTASSMPHSERNSPENSDLDSSLSLPFVHRSILLPRESMPSCKPSYAATVASSSTDPVMMSVVKEVVIPLVTESYRPKSEEVKTVMTTKTVKTRIERQPLRKQNSVPGNSLKSMVKTKGLNRSLDSEPVSSPPLESLPAVIMCQDDTPVDTQPNVTFGFFDDDATAETTLTVIKNTPDEHQSILPKKNEMKMEAEVDQETQDNKLPETKTQVSNDEVEEEEEPEKEVKINPKPIVVPNPVLLKRRPRIDCSFGADVNSYNYYEVLAYIRKAWESVIRVEGSMEMKSLTSGSKELI